MKKTITLLLILLMVLASIAYAEPKTNKKTITATTKKKRVDQRIKYSTVQIDTSLEKLPSNYYGNDPKSIYSAIYKRKRSAEKGEFETTEQFQKRIEKEKSFPIIGRIGSDGLFSLQAASSKVTYSADISEISIDIVLHNISEKSAKSMLLTSDETKSTYKAQNSYGATTVVTERDNVSYDAAINNYNELPFNEIVNEHAQIMYDRKEQQAKELDEMFPLSKGGTITRQYNTISDFDKEWRMTIKIKANPEEAKNIKDKVSILLIGNLDEPLIYERFSYSGQATIDSPSEYTYKTKYIYINLNEVWIYNLATGKIYSKIKKTMEE